MGETIGLPNSLNLSSVEGLYTEYLREPASVPPQWRNYFERMEAGARRDGNGKLGPSFRPRSLFNPAETALEAPLAAAATREARSPTADMQDRVDQLIGAYRFRGHMIARINPLGFPRTYPPELAPEFYGFTTADMDQRFSCETIHCDGPLTLATGVTGINVRVAASKLSSPVLSVTRRAMGTDSVLLPAKVG